MACAWTLKIAELVKRRKRRDMLCMRHSVFLLRVLRCNAELMRSSGHRKMWLPQQAIARSPMSRRRTFKEDSVKKTWYLAFVDHDRMVEGSRRCGYNEVRQLS